MIGVVGNNMEHFSALWATTRKNVQRCRQRRRRIATTQNSKTFICEPLSSFKETAYLN
jgi:hypothetical protein